MTRRNPLPKMNNDWKPGHPTIYIYMHTYLYMYSYLYTCRISIYRYVYLHIYMAYMQVNTIYTLKKLDDFISFNLSHLRWDLLFFESPVWRWVSTSKRSHQWILRFLTSREGVVNRDSLCYLDQVLWCLVKWLPKMGLFIFVVHFPSNWSGFGWGCSVMLKLY